MTSHILGISAFYHDSAAAILVDGKLLAAAQQERFSRLKHDPGFPADAIAFCLQRAGISVTQLDAIVYYDKPFLTFDRLFESHISHAPRGLRGFVQRMPVWLKEKLLLKGGLKKQLAELAGCKPAKLPPLLFTQHHQSHAASAFYPSPFDDAAVLCLDGVGEWATTSAWHGQGASLTPLWQIDFPDSLGLLYSAFTCFCGFRVNSGEYKLMGLAPYGKPLYQALIEDKLVDIKADGSFRLDMQYFDYSVGRKMTSARFDRLFGGPPRQAESQITQRECDIAASIQAVTEKILLRLAATLRDETGLGRLCLAGGVALNCSANGKLAASGLFEHIWIQPAAGDAGGAVGAAYAAWHGYFSQPPAKVKTDAMRGSYLGPAFDDKEICTVLDQNGAIYTLLEENELIRETASLIHQGHVVGWFQGRMEFGPRALGNRSILADPTRSGMQSHLNRKIKFRESFRPFAPSVTTEKAHHYFSIDDSNNIDSPYMLLVATLKDQWLLEAATADDASLLETLQQQRSQLPAITHVDASARVQTVNADSNPRYHALLGEFEKLSGHPVLINTSFNVRGEPVVCSPQDAWNCFMHTDMDYLVIGDYLLDKQQQQATSKHRFRPQHLIMD